MSIPNYEKCVKYALQIKSIAGESFKDTDLRVYERNTANPAMVFTVLKKGGIFIPVVEASLFGHNGQWSKVNGQRSKVTATVVLKANSSESTVELFDPTTDKVIICPVDTFITAWESTGGSCTTAFPLSTNVYHPKLIDLKHVQLSSDFDELREAIAENAHDTWAMERQSEGWTYGPHRDDQKLETPDMIPYSQLPESEKQYDRIMAEDTLKLLTALGYKIVKNE